MKEEAWYKKLWNKVQAAAKAVWRFICRNWGFILGVLIGLFNVLCGYIMGFIDGHKEGQKVGYEKGKVRGHFDGADDVISSLNEGGYSVYSGCGKDAGKWSISKKVEIPLTNNETSEM